MEEPHYTNDNNRVLNYGIQLISLHLMSIRITIYNAKNAKKLFISSSNEFDEVSCGLGRFFSKELDLDGALAGRNCRGGHLVLRAVAGNIGCLAAIRGARSVTLRWRCEGQK